MLHRQQQLTRGLNAKRVEIKAAMFSESQAKLSYICVTCY